MVDRVVCLFKIVFTIFIHQKTFSFSFSVCTCVCLSTNLEPNSCCVSLVFVCLFFFVIYILLKNSRYIQVASEEHKRKKEPNYELVLVFTLCIYRRIKTTPSKLIPFFSPSNKMNINYNFRYKEKNV